MPIDRLPSWMQRPARRARRFLLTDATVLLILGLGCIARGISYSGLSTVPLHPAEAWFPIGVWSSIWIALGVLCIGVSPWHQSVSAALAVAAGVALHLLWGLSFLWATVHGDMPRGWVSAISYLMIVALISWAVWRGSRDEVRVTEEPPRD